MGKQTDLELLRKIRRDERVAALRDGRKNRAKRIENQRKRANKYACRKGNW